MADQPTPQSDAAKEQTITFDLPDVITGAVWNTFTSGIQEYWDKHEKGNGLMADHMGALKVIKAGMVHVRGPVEFTRYLDTAVDLDTIPLSIIGVIKQMVVVPIRNEVDRPLEWKIGS